MSVTIPGLLRELDEQDKTINQLRETLKNHIHVYPPEEQDDEVIVQLHTPDHQVLRTYQRGSDGFEVELTKVGEQA